jgi:hypothetical protein
MTNINEVLGESTLSKSFCARVLIAQSCSSPQFCLSPQSITALFYSCCDPLPTRKASESDRTEYGELRLQDVRVRPLSPNYSTYNFK